MIETIKTCVVSTVCPYALREDDALWTVKLASEDQTSALAACLSAHMGCGDVIALWGTLGAGKSAFARGFIRACTTADEDVPSPTFTLVQVYEPEQTTPIWHFDLYRLEDQDEIWELGFEDALFQAVSLIEWPERMGTALPARRLDIVIDFLPDETESSRQVQIIGRGVDWAKRILDLQKIKVEG